MRLHRAMFLFQSCPVSCLLGVGAKGGKEGKGRVAQHSANERHYCFLQDSGVGGGKKASEWGVSIII